VSPETPLRRTLEWAVNIALILVALAATAWTVFFDVLCIGSCTNSPQAGVWSWLTLAGTAVGTALVMRRRTRRLGRLLLAATVAVAIGSTVT